MPSWIEKRDEALLTRAEAGLILWADGAGKANLFRGEHSS